ncbi:MAG TPA: VOC family protein, partial [Longimicrobiales bacterium]
LTTDREGAPGFYTPVTGWSTAPWDAGDMPYTMWMAGDTPVGGLMDLPDEAAAAGAPPHWMAYISTPSVDATVARAQQLGASLVWGPLDVAGVGRVAGLADPQGAHFAVHEPEGEAPGSDDPPSVGEFSWHELATTDWEGAYEFYTELFGWQKADDMDMGEMGTYRMFSRGAHPLGGMFNKPEQIPFAHWLLYVRVADIDQAVERVVALGGQVLNGPMEVPGGDRVAQCMDPQGAGFALHATKGG